MHILKPLDENYSSLSSIFEKIYETSAVALLGAGASVSNLQFLSDELIKLYQTRISKDFKTNNIIRFVDILQTTPGQRRSDFDSFVVEQLEKLVPNKGHEIFVSIPWKQIITTNYDTLVEEASDKAIRTHKTHFRIKPIRNKSQYEYQAGNNETMYIKLNGCRTDLSLYPLVFSTDDFAKQASFYKKVLTPFKQFSNEIIYIAFGYSFSDEFSEGLLERLLTVDIRQKRKIFCVDPYFNLDNLDYYESKGISIVNLSFEEFFIQYQKWFSETNRNYLKTLQKYSNPDKSIIPVDSSTRLYLDKCLMQFKDDYRPYEKIKKVDFYIGSEPNYQVILDDFDVIKIEELNKLLQVIEGSFNGHTRATIPKIVLIRGDFGTGKTTFTLRAIKEFIQRNNSTLAFEITNGINIKKGYLAKLIEELNANQFIFYCDNVETDSVFKRFNEIRVDLATEQYSDKSIIFISSIRENILEKLKYHRNFSISNCLEFSYKSAYNLDELTELVDNLKEVGLIDFRDSVEKRTIIQGLKTKYDGDSFLSLYSLIKNGTHDRLLKKAYDELTPEIQVAFKFTALVHRFNMECPVSVIKDAIKTMDWGSFTDIVLRGDGKNILFQELKHRTNSDPDLFFKTKHPVIAEALVKLIFRNQEKNAAYKNIFSGLTLSEFNARFVVDLIKNIRNGDPDLTDGQIENYYEICKKEFAKSPHFMLSYITNIEKRTEQIKILENCIQDIEEMEADIDYRNSRLIHRKGSLNFKIARLLFQAKAPKADIMEYLETAEEWFVIKKNLDPTSRYSYSDYLNLLLWKLKYLKLDNKELLDVHIKLNTLLDEGFRLIEAERAFLTDRLEEYTKLKKLQSVHEDYKEFLLEQYQDTSARPIACILLYYYFEELQDYKRANSFVEELKDYTDVKEVVYFLFKYFGRNLYNSSNRAQYFDLVRYNSFLKDQHPMRFYYFEAICDAYDRRWSNYKEQLNELKSFRPPTLNPDFFLYWCDENGRAQIFDGEVIVEKGIKKIKITSLFKEFVLMKGNYKRLAEGNLVSVKLHFSFTGIKAELYE